MPHKNVTLHIFTLLCLILSSLYSVSIKSYEKEAQVFIQILNPLIAFKANNKAHLVYEVYVTNFSHSTLQFSSLKVNDGSELIANYTKEHIGEIISPVANNRNHGHTHEDHLFLSSGTMKILYLWLTFESNKVPHKIFHHFNLKKPPSRGNCLRLKYCPCVETGHCCPKMNTVPAAISF